MPRITPDEAGSQNVCALLDVVAYAEIGRSMLDDRRTDEGYRVIVGSLPDELHLMTSYEDHPLPDDSDAIEYAPGVYSTAAGRYQILNTYWPHYRDQLGLIDFGPCSQDRYAIQQFREQGAYDAIRAGKFGSAIKAIANVWASMPGAGYGQREHRLSDLREIFVASGGVIWHRDPGLRDA